MNQNEQPAKEERSIGKKRIGGETLMAAYSRYPVRFLVVGGVIALAGATGCVAFVDTLIKAFDGK